MNGLGSGWRPAARRNPYKSRQYLQQIGAGLD
jgi:hypothetical protein